MSYPSQKRRSRPARAIATLVAALMAGGAGLAMPSAEAAPSVPGPVGTIHTMAGTTKNFSQGGPAEHGVPATSSQWQNPRGLNFGPNGDVYVTDALNHMVRRIDSAGIAHHVAGTGTPGSAGDGGDAKLAQLHEPHGVAVDTEGNVYIADSQNCVIRKVAAGTGIISRFAGTGAKKAPSGPDDLTPPCIKSTGHAQPGPALSVALDQPKSLYMTRKGGDDVLYIADFGNNMIRMIDTDPGSGDPQTVRIAGTTRKMRYGTGFSGDALDAELHHPEGVWVAEDGTVYFTDGGNHLVRKVTKSGTQWKIDNVAGSAAIAEQHKDPDVSPVAPGASDGDGGQALSARLNGPRGITGDSSGNLYVAEEDGSRIRRINLATRVIQTIAGDGTLLAQRNNGGTLHIKGDPSGNALEAQFAMLHDIQINPEDGSLWIADSRNNRVRAMANVASIAGANIPNGGTTPPPPPPGPGGGGTPVPVPGKSGYWMLGVDGKVYAFGDAEQAMFGDALGQIPAGAKAIHIEPTPTAKGYWINDDRGGVYFFGDAAKHGGINASALQAGETVTSLSATPSGNGYWLFTSKGRVFNLGDAQKFGDLGHLKLNGAIQSSIPTPSGKGYFMVGSDGGVFAFGDAVFKGSMGATKLNQPVMSLVPTRDGQGYWLVASDGGIFAFNAPFKGSMGATKLNKPMVGMVRYGNGYLMVAADGGIFSFSDKPFVGSLGANPPARPISFAATLDS